MDWTILTDTYFWKAYERFLALGHPADIKLNNTSSEHELVSLVEEAYKRDGPRALAQLICQFETTKGMVRPYLVTAFAVLCSTPDKDFNSKARNHFQDICTSSFSLFKFMQVYDQWGKSGRGRAIRRLLSNFYLTANPVWLAREAVDVPEACGWTHADVLKLCRPWTEDRDLGAVLSYMKTCRIPDTGDASDTIIKTLSSTPRLRTIGEYYWRMLDRITQLDVIIHVEHSNELWFRQSFNRQFIQTYRSSKELYRLLQISLFKPEHFLMLVPRLDEESETSNVKEHLFAREDQALKGLLLDTSGQHLKDMPRFNHTFMVSQVDYNLPMIVLKCNKLAFQS